MVTRLILLLVLGFGSVANAATPSLEVRNILTSAAGTDALNARARAEKFALMQALRVVSQRFVSNETYQSIPTPDAQVLKNMVENIVVRAEQPQNAYFSAIMDVSFKEKELFSFYAKNNISYAAIAGQSGYVFAFTTINGEQKDFIQGNPVYDILQQDYYTSGAIPLQFLEPSQLARLFSGIAGVVDTGYSENFPHLMQSEMKTENAFAFKVLIQDSLLEVEGLLVDGAQRLHKASKRFEREKIATWGSESDKAALVTSNAELDLGQEQEPAEDDQTLALAGALESDQQFLERGLKVVYDEIADSWKQAHIVRPQATAASPSANMQSLSVLALVSDGAQWDQLRILVERTAGIGELVQKQVLPQGISADLLYSSDVAQMVANLNANGIEIFQNNGTIYLRLK